MVKLEVTTIYLNFSVTLISFRPLIKNPGDEFRMDPISLGSALRKFVFPLYLFLEGSSCLLRRGGINLSFRGL